MNKLMALGAIIILGLYATDSSAQLFRLKTNSYGSAIGSDATLRASWDRALNDIQESINKDFPSTSNPDRLMQGMANSSVMAGKGIGSDYASRMEVVLIGAGAGVGADLKEDKTIDSKVSGLGIQGGLVVGTNLSWMDTEKILGLYTDRLNVYANFLTYNVSRDLGGNDKKIDAKFTSLGLHASYDLVLPKGSSLLRWGGVKVHTGYEYNSSKLKFTSSITKEINSSNNEGTGVTGSIRAKPIANIDVATHSIPLEVSTNVQLLYFLSLYTGLGVDVNFGSAKGSGSLDANETQLGATGPTIEAKANADGSGRADTFLYRGFAGVQLNIPYVNIFAQVDKALGNELVGVSAGVRFVY